MTKISDYVIILFKTRKHLIIFIRVYFKSSIVIWSDTTINYLKMQNIDKLILSENKQLLIYIFRLQFAIRGSIISWFIDDSLVHPIIRKNLFNGCIFWQFKMSSQFFNRSHSLLRIFRTHRFFLIFHGWGDCTMSDKKNQNDQIQIHFI